MNPDQNTVLTTPLESALDVLTAASESTDPDDYSQQLVIAKCKGLIQGYDVRWRELPWVAHSVEETFHLPIINPETGRASRSFTHAGKYDGIVEYEPNGKLFLMEHKTCSEDIADPNAPYWRRLTIDAQVSGYMLANWQDGRKLDGTLYDVVRKPSIRPKKLSKADQKKLADTSLYFGVECPVSETETLEMYTARLAADTKDRTDWYFQRRPVMRLDAETVEFAQELWEVSKTILEANRTERHYRNSGACMMYSTPCEYLGICSGHDTPDSDNWQRRERVHEELPELSTDDERSILTQSRIQSFKTCRRKHHFRYGIGIVRSEERERESLYFGRLWHDALAAWWSCFLKG